jgi:hypothetical protein
MHNEGKEDNMDRFKFHLKKVLLTLRYLLVRILIPTPAINDKDLRWYYITLWE